MMQKRIDRVADVAIDAVDEFLDSYLEAYSDSNDNEFDYGVINCALILKDKLPKIVRNSTDKINFSPLTVAADRDETLIVCLYEEVLDKLSEYYGICVFERQREYKVLLKLLDILTDAVDSRIRRDCFIEYVNTEDVFHADGPLRRFANSCFDLIEDFFNEDERYNQ